jgi:hypothetical protein
MLTQLFQARAMCFDTVAYGIPIIFTLDKSFLKLINPTSPQGQVDIDLYFHHFSSDVDSKWRFPKIGIPQSAGTYFPDRDFDESGGL